MSNAILKSISDREENLPNVFLPTRTLEDESIRDIHYDNHDGDDNERDSDDLVKRAIEYTLLDSC